MIREGTEVMWIWGSGTAQGKVQNTYPNSVTKTIKGTDVTRNGEEGNKALYIKTSEGDMVLKLESEVEKT